MTIILLIVMESPASYVNAKKSNDDGTSNTDRCFQAGKDDGRNSGSVRVNSIIVALHMSMDL
jgi:hypothetical protein